MNVKIHAIHFDIAEKLEAYSKKRIEKFSKLSDDIINVNVYFKVVKPEVSSNKEAEIKVTLPNGEFFASKITNTFEESLDTAAEAIEKQIIKFKEKGRN
jgi:putative sigma-54 modulation protein